MDYSNPNVAARAAELKSAVEADEMYGASALLEMARYLAPADPVGALVAAADLMNETDETKETT